MEIEYLSTTLLNGWLKCPKRTWSGHELRQSEGDDQSDSAPLQFGSIVHDVAEEYHRCIVDGEDPPAPIDLFDEIWKTYPFYDVDYFVYGREVIQTFLERTLFQREGDTIRVELPFIMDLETGKVWETDGQESVRKIAKKIRAMGGVPIASKIDRVDKLEDGSYEIYDYKSNYIPFTRDEVDNSLQLFVYDQALRGFYKLGQDVDIRCVFDMVRHGRYPTIFSPERRATLAAYIRNLWDQIVDTEEPREYLNSYCSYCEFRRNCETYREAISQIPQPIEVSKLPPSELMEIFTRCKNVEKAAKAHAAEISDRMNALMVENDSKPFDLGNDQEAYFQKNPRYEYPANKVFTVLRDNKAISLLLRTGAMTISRPKLDQAISDMPELKEQITPLLQVTHARPSLKSRPRSKQPKRTKKRKK